MPRSKDDKLRDTYYYHLKRGSLVFDENFRAMLNNPKIEKNEMLYNTYIKGSTPLTNLYYYLLNMHAINNNRSDFADASPDWKAFREEFIRTGDIPKLTPSMDKELHDEINAYNAQEFWLFEDGELKRKNLQHGSRVTLKDYQASLFNSLIVDKSTLSTDNLSSIPHTISSAISLAADTVLPSDTEKKRAVYTAPTPVPHGIIIADDDTFDDKPSPAKTATQPQQATSTQTKIIQSYRNAANLGNVRFDNGVPYFRLEHLNKPEYKVAYENYIAGQTPLTVLFCYLKRCFRLSAKLSKPGFEWPNDNWKNYYATCVSSKQWLPIPDAILADIRSEIEPVKHYWKLSPKGLSRVPVRERLALENPLRLKSKPKSKKTRKSTSSREQDSAKKARTDVPASSAATTDRAPFIGDEAKRSDLLLPFLLPTPPSSQPLLSISTTHSTFFYAPPSMPHHPFQNHPAFMPAPAFNEGAGDTVSNTPDAAAASDQVDAAPSLDTLPDAAPGWGTPAF